MSMRTPSAGSGCAAGNLATATGKLIVQLPPDIAPIHRSMKARCRRLDESLSRHRAGLDEHRGWLSQTGHQTRTELTSMQGMKQDKVERDRQALEKDDCAKVATQEWLDSWRATHSEWAQSSAWAQTSNSTAGAPREASMDSPELSGGEVESKKEHTTPFTKHRWEAFVPHGPRWTLAPRVPGTDPCTPLTLSYQADARHQALFGQTFSGTPTMRSMDSASLGLNNSIHSRPQS